MGEKINFESVLKAAASLPMVKINRASFLNSALKGHYDSDTVKHAVEENPASAGIPVEDINKIAKVCINRETIEVTAISAVAGVPGGLAMIGTIPADFIQYFGHVLRILQKLAYLYGWPSLLEEDDDLDDGTAGLLTLFAGIMFGVVAANRAVEKIAGLVAIHTEKAIIKKALEKGVIYPIVKKVAGILSVKMTKAVFAKGVSKVVPIAGAVVSGGMTFFSFRPMANKLKNHLSSLPTADPKSHIVLSKDRPSNTIQVDYTEPDAT